MTPTGTADPVLLKGKGHEIPRSADRDTGPLVHRYCCICDAQAADYRRASPRSRRELAGSVGHTTPVALEADEARDGAVDICLALRTIMPIFLLS
jgi:hypothetical protein